MKISSKLKGCKRSEATKLKQHNAFNSKTEEEKQLWRNKISNTSKGRKLKDYQIAKLIATTTKTSVLNLNTGEYFPTIKDALLKYNFKKLQGKMFEIKKHYNYYWLFFPKDYKPDYSFIYDKCYKFFEDKILYYVEKDLYFYSVVELGKYLNKEDLTQLKTCIKNKLPIDSMNIRKCNYNELDTFIRNFLVNINT